MGIKDFFSGARMDVQIRDPANDGTVETYEFIVEPMTPPGARVRIQRTQNIDGGFVVIRLRPAPGSRFRARGSDLRCTVAVPSQLAARGGVHSIRSVTGEAIELQIPKNVRRGEIICISEQGLPRAGGGRGDLLVRITYRPGIRTNRLPDD